MRTVPISKKFRVKLTAFALTLLFSASFTATCFLCIAKLTILDEQFFCGQINKSGYARSLMNLIRDDLESHGASSGFDPKLFSGAVTMRTLEADLYREAEYLYGNRDKGADYDAIYNNILSCLRDAAISSETPIPEPDAALANTAGIITDAYRYHVSSPIPENLPQQIKHAADFIIYLIGFAFVLDAVCVLLIILVLKSRRRKFECVLKSIGSALLILLTPACFLSFSNLFANLNVSNEALYLFIQTCAASLSNVFMAVSAILFTIWIFIFIYRKIYVISRASGNSN